nr:ribonuclease H-like domain-containing protein [Tanacetum cinerariifolium]
MANDEEDHALVAEAPIEFALMANTTTENKVFDNSLCSKDCKKNNDSLNTLAQVESRLAKYKEREVKYIEKIRTLEFYDEGKVEYIETLKKELEILKQEKEVVDGKLIGLLSALKNLDNLIESQRAVLRIILMTKDIGTVAALGNISPDYEPFDGGYVSFGHNLVRGLPTKCFENDQNCSACLKGKQHKASCLHGLSFSELRMRPVAFLGSSLLK